MTVKPLDGGLMVVAHPDDETIFGAATLLSGGRWHVLSLTHADTPLRASRLRRATALAGATCELWGLPDRAGWSKTPERAREAWLPVLATARSRLVMTLRRRPCAQVVTHGPEGEYGHVHHRLTHVCVREALAELGQAAPPLSVFSVGNELLAPRLMALKEEMLGIYGADVTPSMRRSMDPWITRGTARSLA